MDKPLALYHNFYISHIVLNESLYVEINAFVFLGRGQRIIIIREIKRFSCVFHY